MTILPIFNFIASSSSVEHHHEKAPEIHSNHHAGYFKTLETETKTIQIVGKR